MPHSTSRRHPRQIETLHTPLAQAEGLPFADLLTAERREDALREEQATWREAVWTPVRTRGAFLSQVISPAGSCRLRVDRVLAWLVSRGPQPCTPKTDPYGKARPRQRRRAPPRLLVRLACARFFEREGHGYRIKGWKLFSQAQPCAMCKVSSAGI